MSAELRLAKFLHTAASTDGQKYIASICAEHPQVGCWLHHFLAKSAAHSVLDYKEGAARVKSTGLLEQAARSTGRLIAAEVKLSRNWQDAKALFKALLTLTACSPAVEIANLMLATVPELYQLLCPQDGQLLVAVVDNKPVYMDMPVFDIIVPVADQLCLNVLRRSLNNSHTPARKLATSFNAALTRALGVILSFSWMFFDDSTLHLLPTRLLGSKILLCPADTFPDAAMLLKGLETRSTVTLPPAGITVPAPDNKIGVTQATLWQRDEWLLGLLAHGSAGTSMVIVSPTLHGHLSLWLLLAHASTPAAADPLANLTLSTYLGLKADRFPTEPAHRG